MLIYCQSIDMSNLIIQNNGAGDSGSAVTFFNTVKSRVNACAIKNNPGPGGLFFSGCDSVTIVNSDIYGNTRGVTADTSGSTIPPVIDARNNWWGSETGPFHPQTNPEGKGNSVGDYVDYRPWKSGVEMKIPVSSSNSPRFIVYARQGKLIISIGDAVFPSNAPMIVRIFDIRGRLCGEVTVPWQKAMQRDFGIKGPTAKGVYCVTVSWGERRFMGRVRF
jgi:hypothetical protein